MSKHIISLLLLYFNALIPLVVMGHSNVSASLKTDLLAMEANKKNEQTAVKSILPSIMELKVATAKNPETDTPTDPDGSQSSITDENNSRSHTLTQNGERKFGTMKNEDHPFLSQKGLPDWQKLKPKYIEGDIDIAIRGAQKNIDVIANSTEPVTFENTIYALEHTSEDLERAWTFVEHQKMFCDSDELRGVYEKVQPKVTKFATSIYLNQKLWKRIKAYSDSEAAKKLSDLDKRLLRKIVDAFRDCGADLSDANRERFQAIQLELSGLRTKFSKNCLDSRNKWEKYVGDVSLLKGLTNDLLAFLAKDAQEHQHQNEYRLSLNESVYYPCMQYLDSEELRKELYEAMLGTGRTDPYNNFPLIEKILALRDEEAKLLGYRTHADYKVKDNLLKSGNEVLAFIENLFDEFKERFHDDKQLIEEQKRKVTTGDNARLHPWDVHYFAEKLIQETCRFDEKQLLPYFEMKAVMAGLFEIFHRLYGVKILECKTFFSDDENMQTPSDAVSVWHKDVKFYHVFDQNGTYIGGFYTDWHSRKQKFAGAACALMISGMKDKSGCWQNPIGVVFGNFMPSIDSKPLFLRHFEVQTIFHEMGHLINYLLTKVEYEELAGLKRDFVEFPSQIMENFTWDRRSVDLFAKHHETGEKIPDDLFDGMLASRKCLAGEYFASVSYCNKLDMELHHRYEQYKEGNLEEKLYEVLKPYGMEFAETKNLIPILPTCAHIFTHGYDARFYVYSWTQALEADAFTRFCAKDGGVDYENLSKIGQEFREKILSRGDSQDAELLFRDFMHRPKSEPLLNLESLLIRYGIKGIHPNRDAAKHKEEVNKGK